MRQMYSRTNAESLFAIYRFSMVPTTRVKRVSAYEVELLHPSIIGVLSRQPCPMGCLWETPKIRAYSLPFPTKHQNLQQV